MKCQNCATEMTCVFLDWYCPKGCLPDDFDVNRWLKLGVKLVLTQKGFDELATAAPIIKEAGVTPGTIVTIMSLPAETNNHLLHCSWDDDEIDFYGRDEYLIIHPDALGSLFELHAMPSEPVVEVVEDVPEAPKPANAKHWFVQGETFTLTDYGAKQMNGTYPRPNGNTWKKGDYGSVVKTPTGIRGKFRMDIEPGQEYDCTIDGDVLDKCFEKESTF